MTGIIPHRTRMVSRSKMIGYDLIAQDSAGANRSRLSRRAIYFLARLTANPLMARDLRRDHYGQECLLNTTEWSAERAYRRMRSYGSCVYTDGVDYVLAGRHIDEADFMDLLEIGALQFVREERRMGIRVRLYRAVALSQERYPHHLLHSTATKVVFNPDGKPFDFADMIGATRIPSA